MWMYEEMIGKQYGNWTVLEYSHFKYYEYKNQNNIIQRVKRHYMKCECICGTTSTIEKGGLLSGKTKSCGCLKRKANGKSDTRIYNIYCQMINRCYKKKNTHYKDYGGRGIKVCDEWLNDFEKFYEWSIKKGYKDELTIERKNNDLGYSPENCVWADRVTQANNRRNTLYLTYKGETKTIRQWSKIIKISPKTLDSRMRRGWTDEEIVGLPKGSRK